MEAQRGPVPQPRTQASKPSSFPSEAQIDIPSISTCTGFWVLPPTRVRKRRKERGRGDDGMVARLPGAPSFCVAAQRMLGQAGGWWAMNRGCLWGWWQSPCRGKEWSHLSPPSAGSLPDPRQLLPPCHPALSPSK